MIIVCFFTSTKKIVKYIPIWCSGFFYFNVPSICFFLFVLSD